MKTRHLFGLYVFVAICIFTVPAWAQVAAPAPVAGALPPVSLAVGVVTLLSLVIGALTSMQQTGKLLGQYQLPAAAVTIIAIVLPFLGGALAVLKGVDAINGSAVFWAVSCGVGQMIASSSAGLAVHAHHVVPAMLKSLRQPPPKG